MEKTKISAKEVLDDIHSGITDQELMSRHNLSPSQLQSLFTKLVKAGFLAQSDIDQRGAIELAEEASWACPACGEPQEKEFDKCPECGADVATFKARQVISSWEPSEGLAPLLKDLRGVGALTEGQAVGGTGPRTAPTSADRVRECPACGKVQPEPFDECPVCGIVVARYLDQQRPKEPEPERNLARLQEAKPDKQVEKTVPASIPGTSPEGLSNIPVTAEGLPKGSASASVPRDAESGISAEASGLFSGLESFRDVVSERGDAASDLRTVGKYFTYIGIGMAGIGVLGGLVQLMLGYGMFSFIILGYSILLIVIGGPVWLICRGVSEAIEVSGEISERLEENRALLAQVLKKINREK